MTGHGAKFHRKKEEAIVALLSHRTVEEAANAIGIATRTLLRWLQIPEFRKEYLWRLASMNMAIRGMDFDFGKEPANTFSRDLHPDLRADYIMANLTFNMKEWKDDVEDDDPRWKSASSSPRSFEVTSVKPNRSGSGNSGENTDRGRLTVTNDSLKDLIQLAFGVKDFQIEGGPGWLGIIGGVTWLNVLFIAGIENLSYGMTPSRATEQWTGFLSWHRQKEISTPCL